MRKGVGFYTTMWRTGDTHNLGHFLMLRLDAHAQKEVRDYAEQINLILNAAMVTTQKVGTPNLSGVINNVKTEQYQINIPAGILPIYSFTESIAEY